MHIILKALAVGAITFLVCYFFGWYIAQEPNVAEWHPASRALHTSITLMAVFTAVGIWSGA